MDIGNDYGALDGIISLFNLSLKPNSFAPWTSFPQPVREKETLTWCYEVRMSGQMRRGLAWLACSFSHVQFFAKPGNVACQAPLSMELSRQEYWSGLPFPTSEVLPDRRIEPASPALAGGFFFFLKPLSLLGSPGVTLLVMKKNLDSYVKWKKNGLVYG